MKYYIKKRREIKTKKHIYEVGGLEMDKIVKI